MPSPDTRPAAPRLVSRTILSLSLCLSLSVVGASECATVHRCIASTPLHYDSYIAIFIISAARRCPRPRLTRHRFLPTRLLPFFLPPLPSPSLSLALSLFRTSRRPLLFWQITAGGFKAPRREPRGIASRCATPGSLNGELTRGDPSGCPLRRDADSRGLTRRRGERRVAYV